MIVLTPRQGTSPQQLAGALGSCLQTRLRCTDDVGWLDQERLAVILPDTPADGARKVAGKLCMACPDHLPPPLYTIYTYPAVDGGLPTGGAEAVATTDGAIPLDVLLIEPFPLWKRVSGILGAALGLLLLAPVMLIVALAVRFSSPGPVLFAQWRSGLGGRPFLMYKFRTMVMDAEAHQAGLRACNEQDGPAFKMKKDPRVTRLGRFLRATSLDELPQLWNVLRGEMALVGPRPLPCAESNACRLWQKRRLHAKPGLTCIWQVHGRSRVSFEEWVRMDLRYLRRQSWWLDLVLVILTLPAVVSGRGAH
jgi:lipopolysaccharide/colanic/teichoic acid biosynthesis glycosyltransferase